MTADSPENKVYVSVTNAEEFKELCDKAESLMKSLKETIKQIDAFELEVGIR